MEQQQFLRECGRSYPEAVAALTHFRQLVQEKCDAVVQRRIEEFAAVLGVAHKDLEFSAYAYPPDRLAANNSEVFCLGQQAKRSQDLYLYFYSYWSPEPAEDSAPQGVAIDIWMKNASKLRELVAQLEQHSEDPAFKSEPWKCGQQPGFGFESYSLWMEMKDGDFPNFDDNLNKLFDYTIKFLKSISGIEHCFKP